MKNEILIVTTKYLWILLIVFIECNDSAGVNSISSSSKKIILIDPIQYDSLKWSRGEFSIQSSKFEGDILLLNVECSGNIPKQFELIAYNYFLESDPVQADAILSFIPDTLNPGHSSHELSFDLRPLKNKHNELYGNISSTIILHIRISKSSKVDLRYVF